jgi:hypothetical protein
MRMTQLSRQEYLCNSLFVNYILEHSCKENLNKTDCRDIPYRCILKVILYSLNVTPRHGCYKIITFSERLLIAYREDRANFGCVIKYRIVRSPYELSNIAHKSTIKLMGQCISVLASSS